MLTLICQYPMKSTLPLDAWELTVELWLNVMMVVASRWYAALLLLLLSNDKWQAADFRDILLTSTDVIFLHLDFVEPATMAPFGISGEDMKTVSNAERLEVRLILTVLINCWWYVCALVAMSTVDWLEQLRLLCHRWLFREFTRS